MLLSKSPLIDTSTTGEVLHIQVNHDFFVRHLQGWLKKCLVSTNRLLQIRYYTYTNECHFFQTKLHVHKHYEHTHHTTDIQSQAAMTTCTSGKCAL